MYVGGGLSVRPPPTHTHATPPYRVRVRPERRARRLPVGAVVMIDCMHDFEGGALSFLPWCSSA